MPTVKKRRRLKKKYRIILFFICVFLVLFIVIKTFFKKDESNNVVKNPNSNNYKSLITDSIESDHDSAIDTIFANGMNIESYKAILDQKANYMKSMVNIIILIMILIVSCIIVKLKILLRI